MTPQINPADYDGFGRQVKARRGSDYVSFGYDGLGRLASSNTNGRNLGYQYDSASRRKRLTHPDGFYITYAYDATGALTSLKEKGTTTLVGYTYNTQGQLTSMSRANGKSSTLGYDKKGRMNDYNHTGMNDSAFDYNPANQLISCAVSNEDFQIKIPSICQKSYEVNNLNQYDSVGTKNTSYDNADNLTNYDSWQELN